MSFAAEDAFQLSSAPFSLFWQGEPRSAENVMAATIHGTAVRGFDFPYVADRRSEAVDRPVPAPPHRPGDSPAVTRRPRRRVLQPSERPPSSR